MDKVLSQPDSQAPKNFASLATAAIYAFFFLDGFLFISWFTVLPEFRDTIGLTDAQLGMVLLGFPIGSLIGMPITGWLSTFRPIRGLCMLSLFFVCLSQAMATQAHSGFTFFLCFLLMGIGGGSIGVAMNVAACQTENKFNVTIMSKCHGQFSLGTLTGALIATFLQKASLFYETQVIYISLIAALMGVIAMFCMPVFNQHSTSEKAFSFPPKALWGIGFLAFLALMAEGAMIDWSAIFMKDELQVTSGTMGTALIAFTLSMTIVRLFGDRLTGKFPTANLVKWAGLTTLVGMLIIITSTTITSALIGFFVVGIGIAILMPVIVRTASLHEGAQGINVASVSTVGYFGFLVGPPVIGFLSDAIELRYAFLLVAFIGLLVFVLAHPLRSALNNK